VFLTQLLEWVGPIEPSLLVKYSSEIENFDKSFKKLVSCREMEKITSYSWSKGLDFGECMLRKKFSLLL
jgi:hypothetical protein